MRVEPGLGAPDGGGVGPQRHGCLLEADARTAPRYAQAPHQDTVPDGGAEPQPHRRALPRALRSVRVLNRSVPVRNRPGLPPRAKRVFRTERAYMRERGTCIRPALGGSGGRSAQSRWLFRLPRGVPVARLPGAGSHAKPGRARRNGGPGHGRGRSRTPWNSGRRLRCRLLRVPRPGDAHLRVEPRPAAPYRRCPVHGALSRTALRRTGLMTQRAAGPAVPGRPDGVSDGFGPAAVAGGGRGLMLVDAPASRWGTRTNVSGRLVRALL